MANFNSIGAVIPHFCTDKVEIWQRNDASAWSPCQISHWGPIGTSVSSPLYAAKNRHAAMQAVLTVTVLFFYDVNVAKLMYTDKVRNNLFCAGYRQKATDKRPQGRRPLRQRATGQKATKRNVKMLLSCQDVLERLRVVLKTVEQIVLSSVLVCRPSFAPSLIPLM